MKRIAAGTKVGPGYYWNLHRWAIAHVPAEGSTLAGEADEQFVQLSFLLVLVVAPIMGLFYVMFLPFIGFAMVLGLLAKRAAMGAKKAFLALAALMHPVWRPGEAHLTGARPDEGAGRGKPQGDEELDALASEVDEKRRER